MRWSQRLMTLTHSDIHWCSRSRENVIIIDRCGEFPNVPLLGIRGHHLQPLFGSETVWVCPKGWPTWYADSRFGFRLRQRRPKLRQRFIRAWRIPNKVDSKTLGHKNSIPLEPYLKWVRTRAKSLMMPYPSILPVIIEPFMEGDVPYTILHPDMPTSLEDL